MKTWHLLVAVVLAVVLAPACKTEGFCFENCGPRVTGNGGGANAGAGGTGQLFDGGLGGRGFLNTGASSGSSSPSNPGRASEDCEYSSCRQWTGRGGTIASDAGSGE